MTEQPRGVLDWLRDGRGVLDEMLVEAARKIQAGAPIVQEDLLEGVRISKQLVRLDQQRR